MKPEKSIIQTWGLPAAVFLAGVVIWGLLAALHIFPQSAFPAPGAVLVSFVQELRSGRLFDDLIASLFRVSVGFVLAVALGVPLGLWLGHHLRARLALLPAVNFFRNLSPLAWIPFAILWFGIGDAPAIFLIFLSSFFPVVLAVTAAVGEYPLRLFPRGAGLRLQGPDSWSRTSRCRRSCRRSSPRCG